MVNNKKIIILSSILILVSSLSLDIIRVGEISSGGGTDTNAYHIGDTIWQGVLNITGTMYAPIDSVIGNELRNFTFTELNLGIFGNYPEIIPQSNGPLGNYGAVKNALIIEGDNPLIMLLKVGVGSATLQYVNDAGHWLDLGQGLRIVNGYIQRFYDSGNVTNTDLYQDSGIFYISGSPISTNGQNITASNLIGDLSGTATSSLYSTHSNYSDYAGYAFDSDKLDGLHSNEVFNTSIKVNNATFSDSSNNIVNITQIIQTKVNNATYADSAGYADAVGNATDTNAVHKWETWANPLDIQGNITSSGSIILMPNKTSDVYIVQTVDSTYGYVRPHFTLVNSSSDNIEYYASGGSPGLMFIGDPGSSYGYLKWDDVNKRFLLASAGDNNILLNAGGYLDLRSNSTSYPRIRINSTQLPNQVQLTFYNSTGIISSDLGAISFASSNLTTTGNITAGFYFGDGSQLTNLPKVSNATYADAAGNIVNTTQIVQTKVNNATFADDSDKVDGHHWSEVVTTKVNNATFADNANNSAYLGGKAASVYLTSNGMAIETSYMYVNGTRSFTGGDVNLGWSNLTSYPSACSSGQYISALGDTVTCGSPPTGGVSNNLTSTGYVYLIPNTTLSYSSIINQETGSDNTIMNDGSIGQTFTTLSGQTSLTSIWLDICSISNSGGTATINVTLRTSCGGTIIGYKAVVVSRTPGSCTPVWRQFNIQASVTPSTTYYFSIEGSADDGGWSSYLDWITAGNVYSGGAYYNSCSPQSYDGAFRIDGSYGPSIPIGIVNNTTPTLDILAGNTTFAGSVYVNGYVYANQYFAHNTTIVAFDDYNDSELVKGILQKENPSGVPYFELPPEVYDVVNTTKEIYTYNRTSIPDENIYETILNGLFGSGDEIDMGFGEYGVSPMNITTQEYHLSLNRLHGLELGTLKELISRIEILEEENKNLIDRLNKVCSENELKGCDT